MSGFNFERMDCPQCGCPSFFTRDLATDETHIKCEYCGYKEDFNEDGSHIVEKGYGSAHFIRMDGVGDTLRKNEEIILFKEPPSMDFLSDLFKTIREKYNEETSSVFVWNDKENRLEARQGSLPRTIEEEFMDKVNESDYMKQVQENAPDDGDFILYD